MTIKDKTPVFGAYILENSFSMKYEARSAVLKLVHASESPIGVVKTQISGLHPQFLTQ